MSRRTAGAGRRDAAAARRCLARGDLDGAEAVCRHLLKRNRRDVEALTLRAAVAVRRFRLDDAHADYRAALALRPRDPRLHVAAGRVAAMQGRFQEALRGFDRALELRPGDPEATEWKAIVLEWSGDDGAALGLLEPFVARGAESPAMAEACAKVQIRAGRSAEALEVLRRHLDGRLDPDQRHRLGHLAGAALEKLGEHDAAFDAHDDANRAVAQPFDPAAFEARIDALVETFTPELFSRLARPPAPQRGLVFIAGMPRSGTTLIEQIIDAHPRAAGAGELGEMQRIADELPAAIGSLEPYPRCAGDLGDRDVEALADRYLRRVNRIAPPGALVVNKSLDNWHLLGLIAALLPTARVVRSRRDARDTCLSCFFSSILPGKFPFVTDRAHLGLVHRAQQRLMDHWCEVLPLPVLDVRYEALVEDPEAGARRIIDFCGLAWDERCLRFHESRRAVLTLSYEQVRRPIYRSSIGRWKRYEHRLGPLLEALGPHTDA